jgi:hypothetical protein
LSSLPYGGCLSSKLERISDTSSGIRQEVLWHFATYIYHFLRLWQSNSLQGVSISQLENTQL